MASIIITANDTFQKAMDAFIVGADGYIVKSAIMKDEIIYKTNEVLEKQRLQMQLKESEEKYRYIIHNISDTIIELDSNGIIQYATPQFLETFGYCPEEKIGTSVLEMCHPNDMTKLKNNLKRMQDSNKELRMECRVRHKDRHVVHISGTGRVVKNDDGFRFLISIRDITEMKQLQEEINEKKKLAAIGQLAAGIAHEINTPLANINLTSECILDLLKNGDFNIKEIRKLLNDNIDQVNFCAEVVKGLLQFSKNIYVNPRKFSLNNLIKSLIKSSEISSKIKKKNINIILELEKEVELLGDEELIHLVFQNILENSIDALEGINHQKEINIISSKNNGKVEIKIIDNGKGMSESSLMKVFEPFFSTKEVGKGKGLGLATCKGIIEKHGGNIFIDSTYGKGTKVSLVLNSNTNG